MPSNTSRGLPGLKKQVWVPGAELQLWPDRRVFGPCVWIAWGYVLEGPRPVAGPSMPVIGENVMSDLLKWSPFNSPRWSSPFNALLRSPAELMDSLDRLFASPADPAPIRVEEFVDGQTLVVRAEMPGVDPDKDVEITVGDGYLRIRAERVEKEEHKDKGRFRSEFRYGSFSRSLPLPDGVKEDDIKATYSDGVLEVRTPLPEEAAPTEAPKKLPITRS